LHCWLPIVNAQDTGAIRANQSPISNSVTVTNIYDLNRDGRVNAQDTGILRANQQAIGIVAPFTVPAGAPPAGSPPAGAPPAGSPPAGAPPFGGMGNVLINIGKGGGNATGLIGGTVLGAAPMAPAFPSVPRRDMSDSGTPNQSVELLTGSGEGSDTILAGESIKSQSNMTVAVSPTSNAKESKIKTVAQLDFSISDRCFASFDGDELL